MSVAAAFAVAAVGAGVAANAQPSPTKLQMAEAHAIDVLNAELHVARPPSASAQARRSAEAIEKRFFASGSKSRALAILAEAPPTEQSLVAWDVAHVLDGVAPSATVSTASPMSIGQNPPPDPNDLPQPSTDDDPAPPPPSAAYPESIPNCWHASLEFVYTKNHAGHLRMTYRHNVKYCQDPDNPALINFDPSMGGVTAEVTYCSIGWIFDCTVDATVPSSLPVSNPGHYPFVTTTVAASYSFSFGVGYGPISHDFTVAERSSTTVTMRMSPGPVYGINVTGTCQGEVRSCRWVKPDSSA